MGFTCYTPKERQPATNCVLFSTRQGCYSNINCCPILKFYVDVQRERTRFISLVGGSWVLTSRLDGQSIQETTQKVLKLYLRCKNYIISMYIHMYTYINIIYVTYDNVYGYRTNPVVMKLQGSPHLLQAPRSLSALLALGGFLAAWSLKPRMGRFHNIMGIWLRLSMVLYTYVHIYVYRYID